MPIGWASQKELREMIDIKIYRIEGLETTIGFKQMNSTKNTASVTYEEFGKERPNWCKDHFRTKKKGIVHNESYAHSLLSIDATPEAREYFKNAHKDYYLKELAE